MEALLLNPALCYITIFHFPLCKTLLLRKEVTKIQENAELQLPVNFTSHSIKAALCVAHYYMTRVVIEERHTITQVKRWKSPMTCQPQ